MFASVLGPSSSRSAAQESGQPKALQASPVHIPSTGPEQQLPLPVTAPPGLETTGSVFVFQETFCCCFWKSNIQADGAF
ncbi:hypothetical protein BDV35DRAFT_386726 [Aspergillus flavus]|uniref:Uncharacterized protein n=1 Tax=Aspergillus flavus TaxID=5059 RepID=A0A5N6HIK5_ASPFL|nr:hypothetical protein BDV35DRAFT_386726 [Aspergillus flavus]